MPSRWRSFCNLNGDVNGEGFGRRGVLMRERGLAEKARENFNRLRGHEFRCRSPPILKRAAYIGENYRHYYSDAELTETFL